MNLNELKSFEIRLTRFFIAVTYHFYSNGFFRKRDILPVHILVS